MFLFAVFAVLSYGAMADPLPAPNHFYPYGTGEGDSSVQPNDDGSSGEIQISTKFPYFDELHDSLYVDTNGVVSFLREVSQYTPDAFPLAGDRRMVAPFWADVDTRRNDGRVYYRETMSTDILDRATRDVRRAFVSLTHFTATWVFIASWHKVTYYGGSSETAENTFQVVLVTNGRHSFTIFNYGDILWTTGSASSGSGGLGGTPAQVGFNAGDGHRYFSVPGSRQSAIVDVENTSNVGISGRWMFRIDDVAVEKGGCNTEGTLTVGPRYGSMFGGQTVIVSGPCFDNATLLKVVCKFDNIETPAEIIDAIRAQCVVPMLLKTGRIPLALSVDGGLHYTHTGVFTLVAGNAQNSLNLVIKDMSTPKRIKRRLKIVYETSYFETNFVDVDFIAFTYQINGSIQIKTVPLITAEQNTGRLSLTVGQAFANKVPSDVVGAIRVRPAGSSADMSVKSLWSKLQVVDWKNAVASIPCLLWYKTEKKNPPSAAGLPACPCTRQQADVDTRFENDPACANGEGCKFHVGADHCVRSVSPSFLGAGQQCCYDVAGDILPFEKGGGTFDRSHYKGYIGWKAIKIPIVSHFFDDVLPYYKCCVWSNNCDKYGEMRPTDDCTDYDPPQPTTTFGDPHVITIDGLSYTFNGLGEFWLVRTTDFLLQARATQSRNMQGNLVRASSWTTMVAKAVNGSVVQVQVNPRTGLDIYIDGVKEDFEDLHTQDFTRVTVSYYESNGRVEVRHHGNVEYVYTIKEVEGTLSLMFNWPNGAVQPRGLLGNANENVADDMQTPSNVIIASNARPRDILERFALSWMTEAADSLFVYDVGTNHATFANPSFEPLFDLPTTDNATLQNVTRICSGCKECMFDYLVTGNWKLALATAATVKHYNTIVEAAQETARYDCVKRSPCTAANRALGKFYFRHLDKKKFVQCSKYGRCFVRPCARGTVFNKAIPVCDFPSRR